MKIKLILGGLLAAAAATAATIIVKKKDQVKKLTKFPVPIGEGAVAE